MLGRERWIAAAFASVCAMAPIIVEARSVDYSQGAATIIQSGRELKVNPLTIELHPRVRLRSLTSSPAVDHITLALGMYCSAYKVENPVSQLLSMIQSEWNAAANSGIPAAELDVTVTGASSYRRCVEVGEMNVRCITRVKLNGMAHSTGNPSAAVQINADIERDASVGGFCGSLSRGVGVVSREAALALLVDAEQKLAAPPTP